MLLAGRANPWEFIGIPTTTSPNSNLSRLVHLAPGRSPGAKWTMWDKLLFGLAVVGIPAKFKGFALRASSLSYL